MQKLDSFSPFFAVQLQADFEIQNQLLQFHFAWQDPKKFIKFPEAPAATQKTKRVHNLWQTTCFEAFIRPAANLDRELNSFYYEFNMSPAGLWNVYSFNSYRKPQPPQESADFSLVESKLGENEFLAKWKFEKSFKKIEFSLNAVLELNSGEKTYWALKHLNAKPDFHNLDSFVSEGKLE